MSRTRYRLAILILALLAVAGCSPPSTGPIAIDIEELPDGQLARRVMYLHQGWSWAWAEDLGMRIEPDPYGLELVVGEDSTTYDPTSFVDETGAYYEGFGFSEDDGDTWLPLAEAPTDIDWEMNREACIGETLCFRLRPGARIDESIDGRSTWKTVWDLDSRVGWLSAAADNVDVVAETYDIEILSDGRVVVALGELDQVTRSQAGEWSPSVESLRTLPKPKMVLVLAAFAVALWLVMAWVSAQTPEPRYIKRFIFGLILSGVAVVVLAGRLVNSHGGFSGGVAVFGLLLIFIAVACVSSLATAVRSGIPLVFAASAATAVLAAAHGLIYLLWSRDLVGWDRARLLVAVTFVAVTALSTILLKSRDDAAAEFV